MWRFGNRASVLYLNEAQTSHLLESLWEGLMSTAFLSAPFSDKSSLVILWSLTLRLIHVVMCAKASTRVTGACHKSAYTQHFRSPGKLVLRTCASFATDLFTF